MMDLAKILIVLLLFFLFTAPSTADIRSMRIRSDTRKVIGLQKFGFTHTGHVSIALSSVWVTSSFSQPDPSRIGFFLVPDYLQFDYDQEHAFCDLDSKYITLLFSFRDLSPPLQSQSQPQPQSQSSFNKTFPVTYPDRHSLIYANCNPVALVTMDVRTELYNTENKGTTKDYISVGLRQLPALYFTLSIIYMCILVCWIFLCFKNRSSVHMMDLVVGGLLVMKGLNYIYAAEDQYHLKVTGTHHEWNAMFHLFQFIRAVFLFILIQSISTILPFMEPCWQGKENKATMVMIPLQVLAIVASVACILMEETAPFFMDMTTWIDASMVLDFICFVAMVLPFGCWVDCADRYFTASTPFVVSISCLAGVGCVLFGRYIAWITFELSVSYKYWWLFIALDEIALLVFHTVTVYILRPLYDDDHKMDARHLELDGKMHICAVQGA